MTSDPRGSTPDSTVVEHFVPGRIQVLGKHTGYAGGRSLLCAVDRGFHIRSGPRTDRLIRFADESSGQVVEMDADTATTKSRPVWRIYPRSVVRRCASDFGIPLAGCDVTFRSDLPSSAGLSSSTALLVGLFLALDAHAGLLDSAAGREGIRSREQLAEYLAAIETGRRYPRLTGPGTTDAGVGVRGGSQDHAAILCGVPGALIHCSFDPVRIEETTPLPAGLVFVVGSSGVRASKARGARNRFNRLSDLASRAAEIWRRSSGGGEFHLGQIARSSDDAPARLRDAIRSSGDGDAALLEARVTHFLEESEQLVPAALKALESADLHAFGFLVDRSQELAEELLANQVPETTFLQRSARELNAVAASAFGAGFGGAVWALVREDHSTEFMAEWKDRYERSFPERVGRAAFFVTGACPPARPLPERFTV